MRHFFQTISGLVLVLGLSFASSCQDTRAHPSLPSEDSQEVFTESFEDGTLEKWEDGVNPERHTVVEDSDEAPDGSRFLRIFYPEGQDGGWLTRFFMPGFDSIYVRYQVRLQEGWLGPTKLHQLYGSRTDDRWSGMGKAGICPSGEDFFVTAVATWDGDPGDTHFYTYWPEMNREPDGETCWGRFGETEEFPLVPGQWHVVEHWVRANDIGADNSVQEFWIDGTSQGRWEGLELRTSNILKINSFQISANAALGSPRDQFMDVDDIRIVGNGARPIH